MGLSSLVSIDLPFVIADTDRHGNVRYYFRRRPEKKVRLRGKPGSAEFDAAYAAARDRQPAPEPEGRARPAKGSFIDVSQRYYAAHAYTKLDASTQGWQKRALDEIAASDKGAAPLAMMQPRHVRRMRDAKAETPAAANTMLKALRAMFQWAMEEEFVDADPTRDVKRVQYVTKGHHTWTLDEVDQFERRHPVGTKPRLAFALLLYTACRREDAPRLGPQHISGGRLSVRPGEVRAPQADLGGRAGFPRPRRGHRGGAERTPDLPRHRVRQAVFHSGLRQPVPRMVQPSRPAALLSPWATQGDRSAASRTGLHTPRNYGRDGPSDA